MLRKFLLTIGSVVLLSSSIAHAYNTPINLDVEITRPAHQGNTGHV